MARLPRRTSGESSSRSSVSMEKVVVTYGCIASFTFKASSLTRLEYKEKPMAMAMRFSGSVEAKRQTSWEALGGTFLVAEYVHAI